ncbi:hypothetical protein DFP72DRAFT_900097 [Ephemerocybe angulata]|uniref:Uncharacterized protein n=1 Tax=Ephemerocybe angulata TaxID=980116 RepID=A0A8H6HY34_9AGAR|nr:hypothetical protein DFP72DRAFT_900097 [Tulosesus angulatus]
MPKYADDQIRLYMATSLILVRRQNRCCRLTTFPGPPFPCTRFAFSTSRSMVHRHARLNARCLSVSARLLAAPSSLLEHHSSGSDTGMPLARSAIVRRGVTLHRATCTGGQLGPGGCAHSASTGYDGLTAGHDQDCEVSAPQVSSTLCTLSKDENWRLSISEAY